MLSSKLFSIIFIILLPSFITTNKLINITCEYLNEFRTHIGQVYACYVIGNQEILTDDIFLSHIADILGNNLTNFNPNVQHFAAENKIFYFMPKGLEKIFSQQLLGIEIINSKLKMIRLKDLEPFKQLKNLNLRGNELKCLDRDVFSRNPNLMFVSLRHNKLQSVDSKFLDNLKHIQQFWFQGNDCFSQNANNKFEISSLIRGIKLNCATINYDKNEPSLKCDKIVVLENILDSRVKRSFDTEDNEKFLKIRFDDEN